jgi:hypothetical protein
MAKRNEALMSRAEAQATRAESEAMRIDAVIDKWEDQQRRIDALLSRFEAHKPQMRPNPLLLTVAASRKPTVATAAAWMTVIDTIQTTTNDRFRATETCDVCERDRQSQAGVVFDGIVLGPIIRHWISDG